MRAPRLKGMYLEDLKRLAKPKRWMGEVYQPEMKKISPQIYEAYNVKPSLQAWGVEKFKPKIIEHINQFIKKGFYRGKPVVVVLAHDFGTLETPRPDEQKALAFHINDAETGDNLMTIGAVFQNGEMSFHS